MKTGKFGNLPHNHIPHFTQNQTEFSNEILKSPVIESASSKITILKGGHCFPLQKQVLINI